MSFATQKSSVFVNLNVLLPFFFMLINSYSAAQTSLLEKVMSSKNPKIQPIAHALKKHEVQIRYTQIQRDSLGEIFFTSHSFQNNDSAYFYPASTVKLPLAILALEKIEALQKQGIRISKDTPFQLLDSQTQLAHNLTDDSHPEGLFTMAHLIKKLFVVSDNFAYNLLFDFVGKQQINQRLQSLGLTHFAIRHRFLEGSSLNHPVSFAFYSEVNNVLLYKQITKAEKDSDSVFKLKGLQKGKAYMNKGKKIELPMDFSQKNWWPLATQEAVLQRLFYPLHFSESQRFRLSNTSVNFLKKWMSMTPSKSHIKAYSDAQKFYDSYGKFLLFGDSKAPMPEFIKIYNKVGYAYGTLTDSAYIVDQKTGISFFLSATILVNQNEIFNDDTYEFETLGIPFLAELGRQVYAHELALIEKSPKPLKQGKQKN